MATRRKMDDGVAFDVIAETQYEEISSSTSSSSMPLVAEPLVVDGLQEIVGEVLEEASAAIIRTEAKELKHEDIPQEDIPQEEITTVTESAKETSSEGIASYKSILMFVVTTMLIWLSEPMLSLVDTTVVGRCSTGAKSILSLAALGPATMVMDYGIYFTYFWAIATVNRLATATAKKSTKDQIQATTEGLGLALILGTILSVIVLGPTGAPLLRAMLGGGATSATDKTIVEMALTYTTVRGAVAPLAVAGVVAQSICLATLDTFTPALAVIAATVVNVVGDLWLVNKRNMGLKGAAIATAAASVVSTLILLSEVRQKLRRWTKQEQEEKHTNNRHSSPPADLKKPRTPPKLFALPSSFSSFLELLPLAGPVFLVILGKIICFGALNLKAAEFGLLALATHNVMIRIFFFSTTLGDSFNQAAQSFLPTALYTDQPETSDQHETTSSEKSPETSTAAKTSKGVTTILRRLAIMSTFFAVSSSVMAGTILQTCGHLVTSDLSIIRQLKNPFTTACCCAAILLHPLIMVFEGSILAFKDFGFLVRSYGWLLLGVGAGLSSSLPFCRSLPDVWKVLVLMNVGRFGQFGLRLWGTLRNSTQENSIPGEKADTAITA